MDSVWIAQIWIGSFIYILMFSFFFPPFVVCIQIKAKLESHFKHMYPSLNFLREAKIPKFIVILWSRKKE